MFSFATEKKAEGFLNEKGFSYAKPGIMGAAGWRNGAAYAWIEHDWCRRKCGMRHFVHIRGM